MKRGLAAWLAAQAVSASAQQAPPSLDLSAPPPSAPGITDEVIRKAVRETIAEDPRPEPAANQQAGVLRAETATLQSRMTSAFNDAKVPDCLHEDALKLQPARIGPVGVVGPLSLPWIVAAVVRGKCN